MLVDIWKGHHFSMESVQKGTFSAKMVGAGPCGGGFPYKTLMSSLPPSKDWIEC